MDRVGALQAVLLAVLAFGLFVWLYIAIRAWAPRARQRGGFWYLEAILFLAVPAELLLVSIETALPNVAPNAALVRHGVEGTVVMLAAFALIRAVGTPRRNIGGLIAAVVFFYLTLVLSGIAGFIPSLPYEYLTTPLIVLAFLAHGDYTYQWLIRATLVALRTTVVLCFASIAFLPTIAFNLVEPRTLFGIHRLAGIAGHPNGLAAIAALGLLLEMRSGSRFYWKLLFTLALLLAQSSTGLIIAFVGILILTSYTRRLVMWLVGALVTAAMIATIFVPSVASTALAAITPENADTFSGRTRIWAAALDGFQVSPFWGYGPELFSDQYRQTYLPGAAVATHAFNQFIQTLSGQGIVGVVSLGLLILVLAVYAIRVRHATGGLGMALVAFLLLRSVTETPLKPGGPDITTIIFSVTVGLLGVAMSDERRRPTSGELSLIVSPPRADLVLDRPNRRRPGSAVLPSSHIPGHTAGFWA